MQMEKSDFSSFFLIDRVKVFAKKLMRLKSINEVWYLLVQYLGYVQKLGLSLVNVLAFVLQLGYCSFGTDYPCDNSNNEICRVIQHFREMGLIFKRKSKEQVGSKKCQPVMNFYRDSIRHA